MWPDDDRAKHKTLLTSALSHTRTALAAAYGAKPEFFPKDRSAGIVYLNPDFFDADVWRFDTLTKKPAGMATAARIDALTEAIELYRGELAHHVEHANKLTEPYENWLRPFREDYRRKVIDARRTLAELLRALDPERALDVVDQAIAMEPWNQRLYETLIGIHLDLGQRHAAERRYCDFADFLTQLGTKPDARLDALMALPVH